MDGISGAQCTARRGFKTALSEQPVATDQRQGLTRPDAGHAAVSNHTFILQLPVVWRVPLQAGDALPAFALTAAVSGVAVDNAWLAGRKAVLVVHGSKSTDAAKNVSKALRQREPDAAKVAFVSIVDLRPFSGLWRKVAEAQIKSSYAKLSEKASAAGLDPRQHVVICPDWDGSVCTAFGVAEPDKQPATICVGTDGRVIGVNLGHDGADAAVGMVL